MAVAYQSSASTAFASATSVVITKPSGVAVGDLLIAVIYKEDTITPPSGWTSFSDPGQVECFYKIATSTEVAASNFTFSVASSVEIGGGMLRITGHPAGQGIWEDNAGTQNNTTTPSVTSTVTPSVANSLLILVFACIQGTGTVSNPAVATSNPSWTEAFQITTTDGADYTMAVYYANRAQTTATGNSSCSFSGAATADWVGVQIAVAEGKDFTVTETVTVTDSMLNDATNLTLDTVTVTDTVSIAEELPWTEQSTHNATWTNRSKS